MANAAEQRTTHTSTKDLKLVEQKPFNGKPDKLENFISECELIFSVKPDIYQTDRQKIVYTLQLMTGGIALPWKGTYVQQGHAETDTWNLFKDRLRESFQDVGRVDNALQWLASAKQTSSETVDEFNTKFRTRAHQAGLALTDSVPIMLNERRTMVPNVNQTMLQHMYQSAIRPELASQIMLTSTPATIEEWMSLAARLDATMRRANSLFAKGIKKGNAHNNNHQQRWKPRFTKPKTDYGEPMDIDAMQQSTSRPNPRKVPQEEIERRKKAQLCYKCGRSGHFANECHTGWQFNPSTTKSKAQESKPKPKGKMTPTQMRHHIRSLISDNFEEGSSEYNAFVEEVEEQGF